MKVRTFYQEAIKSAIFKIGNRDSYLSWIHLFHFYARKNRIRFIFEHFFILELFEHERSWKEMRGLVIV